MMNVRPYVLISNSLLRDIEKRLNSAVSAWNTNWGVERQESTVTCLRSWDASQKQRHEKWQRCYSLQEQQVWLSWSPETLKHVQRQIFPNDQRHSPQAASASLAIEGALAAVNALSDAIAHELGLPTNAMPAEGDDGSAQHHFAKASGSIHATVKIGDLSIVCLINHACAQAMRVQSDSVALEPLKKVDLIKTLATTPVSLTVSVGRVDVAVGGFMELALGDVIRLPSLIDKPLAVLGPEDHVLFGAHLGKLDNTMAIEVAHFSK